MGFYSEFKYGDGVLYGSLSPLIKFWAEPLIAAGGSVHGALSIGWDVTKVEDKKAAMIVARPFRPAYAPEEGDTILLDWREESGLFEYRGGSGRWTYLSLFLLGNDNYWYLAAFTLALPVGEWEFGTKHLPKMLPGITLTDDGGAVSPTNPTAPITGLLQEIGFVMDEVKTYAEALVPFWDMKVAVPQAAQAIASLMDLEYFPDLGPGVYMDLMGDPQYGSSTLDAIGSKVQSIVQWDVRPRVSRNLFLDMNDSSAESTIGEWHNVASSGPAPVRVEYTPSNRSDELLSDADVSLRAYFQFDEGAYRCGRTILLDAGNVFHEHTISIATWPAAQAAFLARKTPGSTGKTMISMYAHTYPTLKSVVHTPVLLLNEELTDEWKWYRNEEAVLLNTNEWAMPVLEVEGGSADVDCIYLGPSIYLTEFITPLLTAWQTSSSDWRAAISITDCPDFGTAVIDWGDDSAYVEISWEDLNVPGLIEHDYESSRPDNTTFVIVVRDTRDQYISAATTVKISGWGE